VEGFNSFKYLLAQWKKEPSVKSFSKSPIDERMLRAFIYTLVDLEEKGGGNATRFNETMSKEGISAIHVNRWRPLKERMASIPFGKGI